MEVKAVARYVRISPQKIRMLIDSIKGNRVETGMQKLKYMPQRAANVVEKVLRSAIANADQKSDIDVDSLVIKNISVDKGPMMKRFRARARGRAGKILKRSSHITVVLTKGSV